MHAPARVPLKVINDAAMQALEEARKVTYVFLGVGHGSGTNAHYDGRHRADGAGHLPYRKATYEAYVDFAD